MLAPSLGVVCVQGFGLNIFANGITTRLLPGKHRQWSARMHGDSHRHDVPLRRIAFGSCRKQGKPQPVWDAVAATEPELWLWTGDSIYPQTPTTPELLRSAYEMAEADRGYRAMLSSTRYGIEGVYDDHDFGENDGGRWYSSSLSQPRPASSLQPPACSFSQAPASSLQP